MAKQMVATETYRAVVNGYSELIQAGVTIVDANDELVRNHPDRWEPVTPIRERPLVEDASATPGKPRGK